jgi:nucleoside 2-deoxyribosyltransferase
MKVVYVAGPFRGKSHWDIAENIRNAERLALDVWRLGAAALCPHANTAHFQDAAPDHVWLDGDLAMLDKCDAIIMTPDWRRSSGATAEHEHALANGIPSFYDVDTLAKWLKKAA